MLKSVLRRIIPRRVRAWLNRCIVSPIIFFKAYMYDMRRFFRHHVGMKVMCREHRVARITALYHVLEKGLSFRESRFLFGRDKVMQLLFELQSVQNDPELVSTRQWQSGLHVLEAYLSQNREMQRNSRDEPFLMNLDEELEKLRVHRNETTVQGGTIECVKKEIQCRAKQDYPQMAFSRYSVRHFSEEPVEPEVVEQAVVWAQKSPSVCNRQGTRVHAISDRDRIEKILTLHGGTRGFTEQIDTLLLITGDLEIFFGVGERNQAYLDAGIFAMSVLYGLHYQGVGACSLHWCVTPQKDRELRKMTGIPEEEVITMLIGVGSLPEKFKVAHSQRRPVGDVLTWHSSER